MVQYRRMRCLRIKACGCAWDFLHVLSSTYSICLVPFSFCVPRCNAWMHPYQLSSLSTLLRSRPIHKVLEESHELQNWESLSYNSNHYVPLTLLQRGFDPTNATSTHTVSCQCASVPAKSGITTKFVATVQQTRNVSFIRDACWKKKENCSLLQFKHDKGCKHAWGSLNAQTRGDELRELSKLSWMAMVVR